jgi:Flp pilus assembly protein protease CpaA
VTAWVAVPLAAATTGAVWDARTGRIPWPLAAATAGFAAVAAATGGWPWGAWLWGPAAFGALEGAVAAGWADFGGGDTALLGALGCWAGPAVWLLFGLSEGVSWIRAGARWAVGQGWTRQLRWGPSLAAAAWTLAALAWGVGLR